ALDLLAVAVAEALLELLYAALGVDEPLLPRVERVVARPDIDVQLWLRAVRLHDDFAVADHLGGDHLGVYALLHFLRSLTRPRPTSRSRGAGLPWVFRSPGICRGQASGAALAAREMLAR